MWLSTELNLGLLTLLRETAEYAQSMKDSRPLFNGLGRTLASRVIVICVSDIKKGIIFTFVARITKLVT